MALRAHFVCLLAGLSALLLGVTAYQTTHARKGQDNTLPPRWVAHNFCDEELRRYDELSRFDGVMAARSEERRLLVERLAAGQLDLFATAVEFKRLNALPQPAHFDVLTMFPGASDNERLCWQVITCLDNNPDLVPPSQRQAVLHRVEADLRDHIARNGTVILPSN